MIKTVLEIEGMACSMCQAHINNVVYKAFPVKKVTSSHKKGRTEIISSEILDESKLKSEIEATGYHVVSIQRENYEKKGFSFFRK